MNQILALMILLTISTSSLAQNATKLNAGDSAPFSGILLTEERASEALKAEKRFLVLSDLQVHQEELTEYHRQDARVQRRKLSEEKFGAFMTNTGYFVLGAVLTALTFKLNQKVGDI